MKHMRMIFIISVMVSLVSAGFCGNTFAAAMEGGPANLQGGVICGPEAWATVVIRTNGINYTIAVRSKQIQDCNVQKDAYLLEIDDCLDDPDTDVAECPLLEDDFINYVFGPSLFDIALPVITKVKNFHKEDDPLNTSYKFISFDAQIKSYIDGLESCPPQ